MPDFQCNLGYCIRSPYLKIKLWSENQVWSENQAVLEELSRHFLPILITYS